MQLLVGIGGNPQCPDVDQLGIEEGLGVIFDVVDQGSQQILWLAAAGAYEDPVAGMNMREDLLLGGELLRIDFPKLLQIASVFHLYQPDSLLSSCQVL